MTGYEEILTDPSYAGQLITFTFPHIGNVGTNDEDIETVNMAATPGARGVILRSAISDPSNYRATKHLDQWLRARGIIGLSGIDTRALTALIRSKGMPNAVIAHAKNGEFDLHGMKEEAREWPGLEGMDLVPMVTSGQRFTWDQTPWRGGEGYGRQDKPDFHVVAIDYGITRNILRLLASAGCRATVVPAQPSAQALLAAEPAGQSLSVRTVHRPDARAPTGVTQARTRGSTPAPSKAEPLALMFADDGVIPNNPRLPLLVYPGAVDLAGTPDPEALIEKTFARHGWGDMWRNGIYPYVHYHSMIHEALGIARGRARVRFGGARGWELDMN